VRVCGVADARTKLGRRPARDRVAILLSGMISKDRGGVAGNVVYTPRRWLRATTLAASQVELLPGNPHPLKHGAQAQVLQRRGRDPGPVRLLAR